MNWYYIFLAIFMYLIIVGCLCSSIQVVPYAKDFTYTNIYESFDEIKNNVSITPEKRSQNILCKPMIGFTGLYCCPNNDFKAIDKFAFTEGKKGCDGIGLYNSDGSLCLNEEQKKLLQTRGGNMCEEEENCKDYQIGPN